MVFRLLWEFEFAVLLPTGGFLGIFLLQDKLEQLGAFNILSNETPLQYYG